MLGFTRQEQSVVVETHATADRDCRPTYEVLASGLTIDVANKLADEIQDAMDVDIAAEREFPHRLAFICHDTEVSQYGTPNA